MPAIPNGVRWALFLPAAIGGCSGVGMAADLWYSISRRVVAPERFEIIGYDVRVGMVSALAAIAFVVLGALVAPRFRIFVAFGLYALGAWIAKLALGDWYFPEGHPRAYQPSLVPLALTLAGGAIGVASVVVTEWRRTRRGVLVTSLQPEASKP